MKVIDIPEPVEFSLVVKNSEGVLEEVSKTLTFSEFLSGACEGYEKFAKGIKMARQYNKIMDVIESINGEKSIQFEDVDFGVVRSAVESATWTSPKVNRACIPFYDAVEKAEDVKPAGKKK